MTIDELEGENTGRYFVDIIGKKEINQFTYRKQFGFRFRQRHQVDEHSYQKYASISF